MKLLIATSAVLLATAVAQQIGTQQSEDHPKMAMQTCTAAGVCTAEKTKIVMDANWRWTHLANDYRNCYTGNLWNTTMCPDGKTCASNCALEGADYWNTYGAQAYDNQVTLKFVTKGSYATNVGSRIYLMEDDDKYKMFYLLNKEFTFDVDVSKLECGLNGALYFSQMDQDGGLSRFPGNKAGAKYGTGYCDAQCARDIKFINGEANVAGWKPSATDVNGGTGGWGSCCAEMDIWEANKISNAYTAHPCTVLEQTRCESDKECGTGSGNRYTGLCDMDGCDLNPFRMGDKTFYGPGSSFKVDTTKKITVVTQFVTDDGTDTGNLSQIKRIYKQGSKVIENTKISVNGIDSVNYISDSVCSQSKTVFGDQDDHKKKGGFKQMAAAMKKGMVLVMSLWDDHTAHCLWLDSKYPTDKADSVPGVLRGTCPTSSGDPKDLEATIPNASVTFSNVKFGPIGSTYGNGGGTSAPAGTVKKYGQCGGNGYTGPTECEAGTTCVDMGEWYSMCQ